MTALGRIRSTSMIMEMARRFSTLKARLAVILEEFPPIGWPTPATQHFIQVASAGKSCAPRCCPPRQTGAAKLTGSDRQDDRQDKVRWMGTRDSWADTAIAWIGRGRLRLRTGSWICRLTAS